MQFEFRPSFERLFKSLKKKAPSRAHSVQDALMQAQERLENRKSIPVGLGLRKLRKNYWEIRASLADRIVFYWEGDLVQWILVGDHNEVRRFLSQF